MNSIYNFWKFIFTAEAESHDCERGGAELRNTSWLVIWDQRKTVKRKDSERPWLEIWWTLLEILHQLSIISFLEKLDFWKLSVTVSQSKNWSVNDCAISQPNAFGIVTVYYAKIGNQLPTLNCLIQNIDKSKSSSF